jgi:uncharacterized hydrophobic protein (TIGR00341 family)
MRQLLIQVPRGTGKEILEIAQKYDGANLAQFQATGSDGAIDLAIVYVSNSKVEGLLGELEDLPELHVTLIPRGVMPLQPPANEAPEQVTNVEPRSPIEIFLAGLQSVGSWKGFLGYAAVAGVVVWIGLFTNTNYLLIAAMLIAPFAGPAMNVAIATARGDVTLLKRSLIRYFAALGVAIVVGWLLSLILQQQVVTELMLATNTVSTVAVLIPLVSGAAGALNLVQSERSSLVSGAAAGMLISVSLAPPAALVGMAIAMGRWDIAINCLFLLLLQLVGINLSASLVFRAYGLSARGARYGRGQKWLVPVALAVTILALISLLTWQFFTPPNLQRSSIAQRANAEIQEVLDESSLAELIEANVRFTAPKIEGQNTLLVTLYVQRQANITTSSEEIRNSLTRTIQTRLLQQETNVTPLIDVSVLKTPNRE